MITRFVFVCIALCVLCSVARGRAALTEEEPDEEIFSGVSRRTRLFRRVLHRRGVRSDGRRQLWGSIGKGLSSAGKAISKGVSTATKAVGKAATTVANVGVKAANGVVTVVGDGAAGLAKVAGDK